MKYEKFYDPCDYTSGIRRVGTTGVYVVSQPKFLGRLPTRVDVPCEPSVEPFVVSPKLAHKIEVVWDNMIIMKGIIQ